MNEIEQKLNELPKMSYFHVLSGFDKDLEDEFSKAHINDSLWMIRIGIVMSFLIYTFFGIIDIFMNPASYHLSWFLCPIIIFCFVFSFFNTFKKIVYFLLLFWILISVFGIFLIMVVTKEIGAAYSIYFSGLILIIIMMYNGLRIRFVYSSITGFFIVLTYELITIFINNIFIAENGLRIFINNSFLIILANCLGMISCYFIEYYMRHTFILRKRIKYEDELKKYTTERELQKTIHERDFIKNLDKMKNDFIANITHEFRTPLTLILGPLETIMSRDHDNDDLLKTMHYNSRKLLKLINDLLDFTRMDAHKMTVKKQNIDMVKLLKFYVANVRPVAENKGLSIVFNNNIISDVVKDKLIVYTDNDLFEKAVFNLISNSLKFTPGGGEIIVQLDLFEDHFDVSVKDTGIGIPEDKTKIIFERFVQLDESSSRNYEGSGIGLALTKEIVGLIGGTISVKSQVNEGSIFTISLPYKGEEIKAEEQEVDCSINQFIPNDYVKDEDGFGSYDRMKKVKHKSKKILIVEDNPDMQKYLNSILEDEFELVFAFNGLEGLKLNENEAPDLIITDIMMSKMDGYEMTERIKKQTDFKNIPIILLTSKTDIAMKLEGFSKGANDYITKPFNPDELHARIRSQLDLKDLRDKMARQKAELQSANEDKAAALIMIEKNEKKLREMLEYLPIAVIEENAENIVSYANHSAKNLLKIEKDAALIGRKMSDLISDDEKCRFIENMKNPDKLEAEEYHLAVTGNIKVIIKSVPFFEKKKLVYIRHTLMELQPNLNISVLSNDEFYNRFGITGREKEILLYLLQGYRNKDIAEKIKLSEASIKKHISGIYAKIKIKNRSELLKMISDHLYAQNSL